MAKKDILCLGLIVSIVWLSHGDCITYDADLHDRCWMYGHESWQFDRPEGFFRIPMSPKISLAEACAYMDIPNLCVDILRIPDDAYCEQFKDLKRLSWVVDNGDLKLHGEDILPKFLGYAESKLKDLPNLVAFVFDDFFDTPKKPLRKETFGGRTYDVLPGSCRLEELDGHRKRIRSCPRSIDMQLVYYERDLAFAEATKPVVDMFDTVTFWTWYGKNVADLERNFEAYRKIAPGKPTILGIYMWDFGNEKPLEESFMKIQLDFALKLFREGRADGFIFHCTPLVNKGFRVVEMCREWIRIHGNEKFGGGVQNVPPRPRTADFPLEKRSADLGWVAFTGDMPESSLLVARGNEVWHVERSGRVAWKHVAQGGVGTAFYHDGWVYYADGALRRVKYELPCDARRPAETLYASPSGAPGVFRFKVDGGDILLVDQSCRKVVAYGLKSRKASVRLTTESAADLVLPLPDNGFQVVFGERLVSYDKGGKLTDERRLDIGRILDGCRLKNGNILYASADALSERTPRGEEVWKLVAADVPGIRAFGSVQAGDREESSFFVGGTCPFAVTRTKKVLWRSAIPGVTNAWRLPR